MKSFHTYTPVRIALPFILGILYGLNSFTELQPDQLLFLIIPCFSGQLVAYHFFRTSYKLRWLTGLLANLSFFLLGLYSISAIDQKYSWLMDEFANASSAGPVICRMESNPAAKSKFYSGNALTIARMDSAGHWRQVKTKILVYFKDDSLCKSLSYGDLIIFSGGLQNIPGPANPYMFSFSKYLYNRQIFHQVFLEKGQWQQVGRIRGNPFFRVAGRCRKAFLETFKEFGIEGRDFALVSALLLGVTDYLDAEIRQEFSYAGATHILSVSGLHVALVYVAADKMLFFLKRGRKSRKLHSVLTIICIWFYALITGLTVSVIRASLMFSLVAAANLFKRSSENYNILAVAAFLQLWINPFEIMDIGFQLSYLAVLGIFAFYKPFNELINSGNRFIAWLWPVIAVSCAAQLATSPLAGYYFSMFPAYFLLTNLIVVPLSGLIIYLAVSLLVAGAAGLTIEWLAWPLKWSLQFMQGSVETIQGWPGAVIQPILLSRFQVVLVYFAIISFFGFFIIANRKWVFTLLGSCLIFLVFSAVDQYNRLNNKEIIVYSVPGHAAIDLFNGSDGIFIGDSLLLKDEGKIRFQILPNRLHEGLRKVDILKAEADTSFSQPGIWINSPALYFMGKHIIIIGNGWENYRPQKMLSCDLVILSGNQMIDPEILRTQIDLQQVIIDSSFPLYKAGQLKTCFEKAGISCHSVRHDGAFVLKW